MRIVFMGTPEFAVATLRALHKAGHDIVGVITAPDSDGGRKGQNISAVKQCALELGLFLLQPPKLKNPEFLEELRSLKADLQVVVAFRMLPEVVWNMPPLGTINLHGSLLPKYRGAAPIHWAVMNGEIETGVTTFKLKHEIDTGEILMQTKMSIGPLETTSDIHDRMMLLGADTVVQTLEAIANKTVQQVPQSDTNATHAPKLHTDTCEINFQQDAHVVHNFIRGLSMFPGAWTRLNEKSIKILRTAPAPEVVLPAGYLSVEGKHKLFVGTNTHSLSIELLQLEGKKRMTTTEFLIGWREELIKFL